MYVAFEISPIVSKILRKYDFPWYIDIFIKLIHLLTFRAFLLGIGGYSSDSSVEIFNPRRFIWMIGVNLFITYCRHQTGRSDSISRFLCFWRWMFWTIYENKSWKYLNKKYLIPKYCHRSFASADLLTF